MMSSNQAQTYSEWFHWPDLEEFISLREELLDFLNFRDEDAEICVVLHLAVRKKVILQGGEFAESLPSFTDIQECVKFVQDLTVSSPPFIKERAADMLSRQSDARLQEALLIFLEQSEAWTAGF